MKKIAGCVYACGTLCFPSAVVSLAFCATSVLVAPHPFFAVFAALATVSFTTAWIFLVFVAYDAIVAYENAAKNILESLGSQHAIDAMMRATAEKTGFTENSAIPPAFQKLSDDANTLGYFGSPKVSYYLKNNGRKHIMEETPTHL